MNNFFIKHEIMSTLTNKKNIGKIHWAMYVQQKFTQSITRERNRDMRIMFLVLSLTFKKKKNN